MFVLKMLFLGVLWIGSCTAMEKFEQKFGNLKRLNQQVFGELAEFPKEKYDEICLDRAFNVIQLLANMVIMGMNDSEIKRVLKDMLIDFGASAITVLDVIDKLGLKDVYKAAFSSLTEELKGEDQGQLLDGAAQKSEPELSASRISEAKKKEYIETIDRLRQELVYFSRQWSDFFQQDSVIIDKQLNMLEMEGFSAAGFEAACAIINTLKAHFQMKSPLEDIRESLKNCVKGYGSIGQINDVFAWLARFGLADYINTMLIAIFFESKGPLSLAICPWFEDRELLRKIELERELSGALSKLDRAPNLFVTKRAESVEKNFFTESMKQKICPDPELCFHKAITFLSRMNVFKISPTVLDDESRFKSGVSVSQKEEHDARWPALGQIFPCATQVGRARVMERLAKGDWRKAREFQEMVQGLVSDTTLLEELTSCVTKMSAAEPSVLSFFDDEDYIAAEFDRLCLRTNVAGKNLEARLKEFLNKSPIFMEFLERLRQIDLILTPIVKCAILLMTVGSLGLDKLGVLHSGSGAHASMEEYFEKGWKLLSEPVEALKFPHEFQEFANIRKALQLQLKNLGIFLLAIEKAQKSLDKKGDSLVKHLRKFFIFDDELKAFSAVLQKSTFQVGQEEPTLRETFTQLNGNILSAYAWFHHVKNRIEPLILGLGELDSLVAVAKIYMAQQATDLKYCFATFRFENNDTPFIKIEHGWNPQLVGRAHSNSVVMSQGAVIIGNNNQGKSKFILMIAHALLMAQAFGIAPAQMLEFTPFNRIMLLAGETSFESERRRAQSIAAEKLSPDTFAVSFFDEPYKSTDSATQTNLGKQLIDTLATRRDMLALIITHNPHIAEYARHYHYKQYKAIEFKVSSED